MSDLISLIYDTYYDYLELCKKLNVVSMDINNPDWIKHFRMLEKGDELIHKENE